MLIMSRALVTCVAVWFAWLPSVGLTQTVTDAKSLESSSLSLVPQDVAFFSTNLNLRDAWTDFLKGDFLTRLRSLPYVQQLEAEGLAQWENAEGQMRAVKDGLENPNVKKLLDLFVDMNSHEIFMYGGSDWNEAVVGLVQLYQDINARSSNPEAMQEFLRELDAEYLDGIAIPTSVVGFRLSEVEDARVLLDVLEGLLQRGLRQVPELAPLANRVTRKDLKDGQVLSIALSTDLIVRDKLEPEVREMVESLLDGLADRKFVLSMGLRGDIMLVAISEDSSPLVSFGEGDSLLENERLEVLLDSVPDNLRTVSYASKEWRESQWQASYGNYFQNAAMQFGAAIASEESEGVDTESWQDEIMQDAAELDAYIEELEIEFDATLAWSFASDVGLEGLAYDWSVNPLLENAEPMTIVRHAGTQPLMLFAMKHQSQPIVNELLGEILDRAPEHARRFIALAEQDEAKRELALEILEKSWPLLEDSYRIVQEEIMPAIDENESLFSVSALWKTLEVSANLPPADSPLPLPELAVAIKVRNRDQFLSGCSELYGVFDRVVELVREFKPDAVTPDYTVPRPEREEIAGATRFFYSELTAAFPLEGFQPQVVVGNDLLVVGYSSRQVADLLEDKPLSTRPAWLAPDMPVAVISMIDLSGMVSAVTPWMTYGFQIATGDLEAPLGSAEGPVPTGNDIIQIWNCLMSLGKIAATSTVDEDGATITRWVWVGE